MIVTTSPPPGVRVDGSCDVEDTRPDIAKYDKNFLTKFKVFFRQRLELYWQENDLGRKISFDFVRNRVRWPVVPTVKSSVMNENSATYGK